VIAILRRVLRNVAVVGFVTASGTVTGFLLGDVSRRVSGNRMAPWIIGRASGVAAYVMLVALVLLGLVLSHPGRARVSWPSSATRIRLHVTLAVFTLAFVVLHVVVLVTDRYAGVGVWGALAPMGASYRPIPVTLGVIGMWSGVLAGMTAASAHLIPVRVWWPLHKMAIGSLVLVWLHGVTAGSDTSALRLVYLATGVAVVLVAFWRYAARTPRDVAAERAAQLEHAR